MVFSGDDVTSLWRQSKFLEVIIDDRLCWKPLIEYIKQELQNAIAVFLQNKEFVQ